MKEYFKMYGLNFVDVSPEEFNNITNKDPKVLYIVAPQDYNNYTGSYNVNLYLGDAKLGAVSDIRDESTNIWELSEGIFKIYGKLIYGDESTDTIGSYNAQLFGLLLVCKPTLNDTVFEYIYNDKIYFGKTSTINGAHVKEFFKSSEIDNELSETSENPVQNKVITEALFYTTEIVEELKDGLASNETIQDLYDYYKSGTLTEERAKEIFPSAWSVLESIEQTIDGNSDAGDLPSAKAVYDYVQSVLYVDENTEVQ